MDGEALAIVCLVQWEQVSRMRQTSRQKFYGNLSPPATLPEVLKPKRIGYPLSDAQILQVLDNLPEGEVHDRWRFATHLCAVYGLRPEELPHLRIKDGANGAGRGPFIKS